MKKIVTTLAMFAFVAGSQADFSLVDDMESGGYGTTWSTNAAGLGGFVADPADASNTVLMGDEPSAGQNDFYRSIPTISLGTTATIFLRVRVTPNVAGQVDFVFGTSDALDPSPLGWNAYEGYGRMGATAPTNLTMDVRNTGGPDGAFSSVGPADPDMWYNVWMVVDNDASQTDFYYNTGAVDATDGSTTSFMDGAFRRSDGNDLITLFVRNNKTGTTGYIDDIYIDLTGENLVNPIPEPSTAILLGLGASAMYMVRRRRFR